MAFKKLLRLCLTAVLFLPYSCQHIFCRNLFCRPPKFCVVVAFLAVLLNFFDLFGCQLCHSHCFSLHNVFQLRQAFICQLHLRHLYLRRLSLLWLILFRWCTFSRLVQLFNLRFQGVAFINHLLESLIWYVSFWYIFSFFFSRTFICFLHLCRFCKNLVLVLFKSFKFFWQFNC